MQKSYRKNRCYFKKIFTGIMAAAFMLQFGNGFAQPLPSNEPVSPNDQQELREHDQQIAQERQTKQEQTDVFLNKAENKEKSLNLPEEKIAFIITEIKLIGEEKEKFPWIQELLQKYQGRKIGREGINIIVKQVRDMGKQCDKNY